VISCKKENDSQTAKQIYLDLLRDGIQIGPNEQNYLIQLMSESGELKEAFSLFMKMIQTRQQINQETAKRLYEACVTHGAKKMGDRVLTVLEQLELKKEKEKEKEMKKEKETDTKMENEQEKEKGKGSEISSSQIKKKEKRSTSRMEQQIRDEEEEEGKGEGVVENIDPYFTAVNRLLKNKITY
jgi:hypothetical protein